MRRRESGRRPGPRLPRPSRLLLVTGLLAGAVVGCSRPAKPVSLPPERRLGTDALLVPTTTVPCSNAAVIETWSVARRAEQLVAVPVLQADIESVLPSVRLGVGGVLLVGNSNGPDLSSRLAQLNAQALGGIGPLVMVDEEGGTVQRLANLVGSVPAPRTMAATLTVDQVRALAASTARKMVANGVTMDLAPDVDLALAQGPSPAHSDGRRSFSADPAVTTRYGLAFAQGMVDGGVVAVIKHFPGEGHDSANTDFGAALTPPLAALEGADLAPFQAAITAGMPAIMVGNATVPGLSTGPASLSAAVLTGLLRQRLGFQGLVLTDSLSAGAISVEGFDVGAAAAKAIAAGADMVVVGSGNPNTVAKTIVDRIAADTGSGALATARLNNAAAKVLKVKRVDLCRITP